jgi:hypothetical protein
VIVRRRSELPAWPDPSLQTLSVLADGDHAAVEYAVQVTDPGSVRTVEHIRLAFLTLGGGRARMIDHYCLQPIPSAQRAGWIAPAALTDDKDE